MAPSDRIERLFQAASDLPANARPAFLASACAGDESLRNEVEALLRAAEIAGQNPLWQAGALANEARLTADLHEAVAFDRYRILERIGAGGMAVVYKAIRVEDDIPQTVAIKIVQAMPDNEEARARFLQERRILARLEHPHIARLLDGGTTDGGLPFLVMEYVDGLQLNRYLEDAGLPTRSILTLFQKICLAVLHAHRNLIAHRDLKPANIIVTAEGEPKLLDFGIATLSDGSALRTRTGAGALTPEYSSPEQVRGEPAGISSDIYALGVLLYSMLTGRLPYRPAPSPMGLAHAIATESPLLLSAHGKRFDADLETIVRMALRKEPARRYQSVEQFSRDIQKYLDGFPVSARPDTRFYRARKFAWRNRLGLAAGVLLVLAMAGGILATLIQAGIAGRRASDVRELANSYMFETNAAISDLPGSTSARFRIMKRGLAYLERLSAETGNDRRLALDLADAYERMALLQGVSQVNVGDIPGALVTERKAIALLEPLVGRGDVDVEAGKRLANLYGEATQLENTKGDLRGAADYAAKALALSEKLVALRPKDGELRGLLADAYEELGDLSGNPAYQNLGDPRTAMAYYAKCIPIRARLAAEAPADVDLKQPLAGGYTRMGEIYFYALGDRSAALAEFTAAAQLSEWIRDNSAHNPWREMNVAIRSMNLMLPLASVNRIGEARRRGELAVRILQAIIESDPQITQARRELAMTYLAQARVSAVEKDHRAVLASCKRAIALFDELIASQPSYAVDLGYRTAFQVLAEAQMSLGDTAGALASATKELKIDEQLLQASPLNAGAKQNRTIAQEQTARAKRRLAGQFSAY